jgi:hypothetical protein
MQNPRQISYLGPTASLAVTSNKEHILVVLLLYLTLALQLEGIPVHVDGLAELTAEGRLHLDWLFIFWRHGRRVNSDKGAGQKWVLQRLLGRQASGWIRLQESTQEADPFLLELFRGPSQLFHLLFEVRMDGA